MTSSHLARLACSFALLTPWLAACGDDSGSLDGDDTFGSAEGVDEGVFEDGGLDEAGEGAGGDGGGGEDAGEPIEPGQLTAGEWRDLEHWDFWRGLFAADSDWAAYDTLWGFHTALRVPVVVVADDLPVTDLPVTLSDAQGEVLWRARTDNLGRAELWPNLFGGSVEAPLTLDAGGVERELSELPAEGLLDPYVFDLESAPAEPSNLDLMFVIDTTGSMGDELSYLQAELGDVISTVDSQLGGELDVRVSVNFYRDHGDAYVVDSNPFTTDVPAALDQLAAQSADGGGDFPEALAEALSDAVLDHEWSSSARARLLFLVLDAPPHDTPDNRGSMAAAIAEAAEQGVRVIPLAASGVDKPTEFLLRDFDIATGGTYTFLTSDSGIGGEHLEPTVGEYQVELLNALLVRLIVEAMQ
jgi:hypothetical protein